MPTLTTYSPYSAGEIIKRTRLHCIIPSKYDAIHVNILETLFGIMHPSEAYRASQASHALSSSSIPMFCMAEKNTAGILSMCPDDIHKVERHVRANGNRSLPPPWTGKMTSFNFDSRPQNPLIGKQCLPVQNLSNKSRSEWDMPVIMEKKASSTFAAMTLSPRVSTSVHSRHLVGDIGVYAPKPPLGLK